MFFKRKIKLNGCWNNHLTCHLFFGYQSNHVAHRGAGASLDYVLTHPDKAQARILNSCGYPPEVASWLLKLPFILLLHSTADNPDAGGSGSQILKWLAGLKLPYRLQRKMLK